MLHNTDVFFGHRSFSENGGVLGIRVVAKLTTLTLL